MLNFLVKILNFFVTQLGLMFAQFIKSLDSLNKLEFLLFKRSKFHLKTKKKVFTNMHRKLT